MDKSYKLMSSLFCLVVIVIFLVVVLAVCRIGDSKSWNNGYCECGGKWIYKQAVGHRYSTNYIYQCDKCGKMHEFMEIR